jgi:hypothetical protein
MSNRTDGVPEMGDPFQDPNSDQKWAEFNTAPEVTKKVAKVDFNKQNRLWHYLGKTSTEARPQYTNNLAKLTHNPLSNFLDTVKPPAPLIPTFQHRPYSAAYPLKPAPVSIPPRTPVQQSHRPYTYKPKESMMTTFRSPNYNPDTRKNPNSPVAHQPNVYSYHRSSGSFNGHGQPAYPGGYHHHRPPQQYVPYAPPQGYSNSGWAPQPTTSGPLLNGISQYAHPPPSQSLPPYPYQSSGSPRELPPLPYSQGPGQGPGPMSQPQYRPANPISQPPPSSRSGAPIANMLSNTTGTSQPPMYAAYPYSVDPPAQPPSSQVEYLAYVAKYPYLKNAFLRRAKTYISPYSPDGTFAPEWAPVRPVVNHVPVPRLPPSMSQPPQHNGLGFNFSGGMPQGLPVPRPAPQFQSVDAFQRDIAKAPRQNSGTPKWDKMFAQLNTNPRTSPTPILPAHTSPSYRHPIAPRPPTSPYGTFKVASPLNHTPPLQPGASEPQRPIPSPLSDVPMSPKRVAYVPGDGKRPSLPSIHPGETWRYTQ